MLHFLVWIVKLWWVFQHDALCQWGEKTATAGCSRPLQCGAPVSSESQESRAARKGLEKPTSSSLPLSSVRNPLQLSHVISVIETSTKNQPFQRKENKSEDTYHDTDEYFLERAALWVCTPASRAEARGVRLFHLQHSDISEAPMNPSSYSLKCGTVFELVTKWPRLARTKQIQKSQVMLEQKFKCLTFSMKKTPN